MKVLVADDDPAVRRLLREILEQSFPDADVMSVGDGERAIKEAIRING